MTRPLPAVQTLRDAVLRVINQPDGKPATRFRSATQDGDAPNLVEVCSNFVNKYETLEFLEKELSHFPYMLTIEDFVCRHGSDWEFDQVTIEVACARVAHFDHLTGHTRYSKPDQVPIGRDENIGEQRIAIELIASNDDPPLRSTEYQAELAQLARDMRALDPHVSYHMFIQEGVSASSFLTGGFTIAKAIGTSALPIIVAWLHGRYGRKVRLKVGDVEVEARTVNEIEKLLKQVDKVRPRIAE